MTFTDSRIKSELPGGDPALINRVAWARRWSDREVSTDYAISALQTASDGQGRRSRTEQGLALRTLGWQARWRGEFDAAMDYCLKAETFLSETAHPETRASLYATLGAVHCVRSRMDLAMCAVDRGLWLLRDFPEGQSGSVLADLFAVRSSVQRHMGERARAGLSLSGAREVANQEDLALVECSMAYWLQDNGDVERALEHATKALALAIEHDNGIMLPYTHQISATCYAKQKNNIEALAHFADGFRAANEDQDHRALCHLNLGQARFEMARGETEKARDMLVLGASIAKRQNMPLLRKHLAQALAEVFEELGQFKASVDQHKLAWRLQREGRAA